MQAVAIVGVGLIGGSFALALRKAGFTGRILGVSSPETLRQAIGLGVIDEAASLEAAASQASLLYLAQPVSLIAETLGRLTACCRPGTLVTDAGSTKAAIMKAAEGLRNTQFLGGHPLAGKETRGVAAAEAGLFTGRTYAVTPRHPEELATPQAREFLTWLERIGAQIVVTDADTHDRSLAFTSHLPQLASTALAALLAREPQLLRILSGPGLLDTTRLALSSFDIWRDILLTNRESVAVALSSYIEMLQRIQSQLCREELEETFKAAERFARELRRN